MSKTIDDGEAQRHRAKMEKRKAVQDAEVAEKTIEKGLLIVHTGSGKGKSTAAFGLALRMLGRGKRVGVVQFVKGAWHTAERDALATFGDQVVWHTMGEGFTWETQDLQRDIAAAERAWAKSQELMADPSFGLVILDELNIALRYGYLNLAAVVAALTSRRPALHVGVTGRNAKPELIAAADLVTEMTLVKHHFAAGVKAQAGIEF
jgi:cob(I)alamin adenosyltransferase